MKTSRLAFSGRVDRIDEVPSTASESSSGSSDKRPDESGEELIIVDYKTGKQTPTNTDARASSALALYAEAAQRLFHRRCRTVELHHVPTGTVARWEHDDVSVSRHIERADQIGTEAGVVTSRFLDGEGDLSADFPTRPGAQCSWCDFRSVCREGEQASVKRQPWDGLAVD
jgi:RecB family exonuclease